MIVNHELAALCGLPECGFLGERGGGPAGEAGRVELEVVSAIFLGAIHRRIGVADQFVDRGPVARIQADAYRRCDVELTTFEVERRRYRRQELGGHAGGIPRCAQVGQGHEEFVAAQAGDDVGIAQRRLDASRRFLEQFVAGLVSERIVDGLEIVQVDEQQRRRGIVTARQREHALEALGQERAIGQAREHVMPCEILDMRLCPLAFGNVAQHAQAHGFLTFVDRLADHFDRHAPAVPMQDVALVEKLRPGTNVIGDSLVFVFRNELEGVVPDHFLARVAGDRQQRIVDIGENAVGVKENPLGGGGGELAHAIFAVAHGPLGLHMASDVGD